MTRYLLSQWLPSLAGARQRQLGAYPTWESAKEAARRYAGNERLKWRPAAFEPGLFHAGPFTIREVEQ